jgi:hypothetical protein
MLSMLSMVTSSFSDAIDIGHAIQRRTLPWHPDEARVGLDETGFGGGSPLSKRHTFSGSSHSRGGADSPPDYRITLSLSKTFLLQLRACIHQKKF